MSTQWQTGFSEPLERTAVSPRPAQSPVELIKECSHCLRGTIAEELSQETEQFCESNKQLLKFHGTYQQEDRDARKARRSEGLGKHHMFMVRCKIPGGRLSAAQYLALDDLAGDYANGTLRFTSRQGIQLHGVLKRHLKKTIAAINHCLLTTLGACGDVVRNVMACPAPQAGDTASAQLQVAAAQLARELAPRSRAYHEIWLDGQPLSKPPRHAPVDVEPLYGTVYLPRKFKIGLAFSHDNCIDVYSQDLGFLALVENGSIVGFNTLVGGGMGMTHGNTNTFPHLAQPVAFIPVPEVLRMAVAVVSLFRDHGNRGDRKRARLKYLVRDWGAKRFASVLAGYLRQPLVPPRPVTITGHDLHLGWHPQGHGKWFYGFSIENGRVKDHGSRRLRSGLRALVERFSPELRITPAQDVLLCNLSGNSLASIEALLDEYGIPRPEQLSGVRRFSLACPAIPSCGLAIAEAERVLPSIIDELEAALQELGLERQTLNVRMTGCPNGCVRPYQSDIGIVGRSGDKYTIFVGGHVHGHRLNFPLKDLVPRAQIVTVLRPLLACFSTQKRPGESFGDWCYRVGPEHLQSLLLNC